MKTQLLCTFAKKDNLNEIIDIIISCNKILFDKIYVFNNTHEPTNLICTYNVEFETDFMEGIPNTISLHRKKHTNTLYTINALNQIILQLNNGVLDKKFPIPWDNYRNCILLKQSNYICCHIYITFHI